MEVETGPEVMRRNLLAQRRGVGGVGRHTKKEQRRMRRRRRRCAGCAGPPEVAPISSFYLFFKDKGTCPQGSKEQLRRHFYYWTKWGHGLCTQSCSAGQSSLVNTVQCS